MAPSRAFETARQVTLWGSLLIALCSGTNYGFSAYGPQLGAQLRITHTQLNLIALAGNLGVYTSGPFWGGLVDSRGPVILFTSALVLLSTGYFGIRSFYDGVFDFLSPNGMSTLAMALLLVFGVFSGLGGNAGLTAAVNATAKSFPDTARATATGLVLSGFGLSAFLFSTIAHTVFPGDTSSFLLLLALGTSIPMLVGIFFVRPIPLTPPTQSVLDGASERLLNQSHEDEAEDRGDVYAPIVVGGVFENVDIEESATPLLASDVNSISDGDQDAGTSTPKRVPSRSPSPLQVPGSSGTHRRARSSTLSKVRGHGGGEHGDVYGKALFRKSEFWLLFAIMSLLSGTGLMWINNVGSVAQALYAHEHPTTFPDDDEASSKLQATQVSFTSIGNCVGRILIGIIADVGRNRFNISRPTFLCFVALAFILSTIVAASVEDPDSLWFASLVIGLSYGGMFGLCPVIVIEWFGLGHFSQNWGFASWSPLLGGNVFSLAFGRNLDMHAPHPELANSTLAAGGALGIGELSPPIANVSSMLDALPIEDRRLPLRRWIVDLVVRGGVGTKPDASHQCMQGRECYVTSLHMTTIACTIALGLSVWATLRDRERRLARERRHGSHP